MRKRIYYLFLILLLILIYNITYIKEVYGVECGLYATAAGGEFSTKDLKLKLDEEFKIYVQGKNSNNLASYSVDQKQEILKYVGCEMADLNVYCLTYKAINPGTATIIVTLEKGDKFKKEVTVEGTKTDVERKISDYYKNVNYKQYSYGNSNGVYGMVAMAKDQIKKDGIVPDADVQSKKINFTQKEFEDFGNAYYGAKVSFDVNIKNKKTVQRYLQNGHDASSGKATYGWTSKTLEKGKTYTLTYQFIYISELNTLLYAMTVDNEGDTTFSNALENSQDDVETQVEETVEIYIVAKKEGTVRQEKDNFTDIFDDISYYEPGDETVSTEITDKVSIVLTVITNIGMVLAVLMSAILGIKYMLGSVEEKADYKKDMIPYLVGAFLLFGICTIVKVLQQFGESINNI